MRNCPVVLPDFLNLGLAPPPPRGVNALAPRLKLAPAYVPPDAFPRRIAAHEPLLFYTWFLPFAGLSGGIFNPVTFTPLIPNPYLGAQRTAG